ncbi:unknown [Clostridium sp. CAG:451]|nr:unknown [Clostridium sp. CAG:451]
MEAKNIMIRLDNFLKKEESKELFSMLGKTITVEDGWITMRKGRKKEEVLLLQDDNNRVRIKGKDTAISLRQNDDDYVVDHIQTGDIENQDINFSMRMIKDKKGNSKYRIRTIEDDGEVICWFSKNEVSFEYSKLEDKKYFYRGENKTNIRLDEEKKSCFATILNLEAKYTTLTGLISSEIPLVNKMIDHCSPITKKNQEIKIYQIKKKNR